MSTLHFGVALGIYDQDAVDAHDAQVTVWASCEADLSRDGVIANHRIVRVYAADVRIGKYTIELDHDGMMPTIVKRLATEPRWRTQMEMLAEAEFRQQSGREPDSAMVAQ